MNTKQALLLMRPQQWFKSASILFGIIIVIFLYEYNPSIIPRTLISFLGVSLLSSTIYILNDYADVESDQKHPTKKNRPIASGKISKTQAILLTIITLITSSLLFYYLNPKLIIISLIFITNNILYSFKPFRLKDKPYYDIIIAGLDFPLRVLLGWYSVTNEMIPSTVMMFPFFIACFLLACKRKAEQKYLGARAGMIKKVYKKYTQKTLGILIKIFMVFTTIYYFLFSLLLNNIYLFIIGPLFYALLKQYNNYSREEKSVVRKPEMVFLKKKKFTIALVMFCTLWIIILLIS